MSSLKKWWKRFKEWWNSLEAILRVNEAMHVLRRRGLAAY
jgi:hypothetical protein